MIKNNNNENPIIKLGFYKKELSLDFYFSWVS